MMLRHLVFILFVTNVSGESTSAVQKASLASEKNQSFGLRDAVVNPQIFTMFRYKGRQVYVYSALSNDHGNVDSPRKWIFYYEPVVMGELGADLNGNLSTAWIVGNDVVVNILLGSTEIDELARKAVMKKHRQDVAKYAEFWDVAPLMIDSLTAYIVKESSNPVEGVHPFSMMHPKDLLIKVRFPCSTQQKAEMVLTNTLDGIYQVEIVFFFGGFRQVSTDSVSITGGQLKNVFSKAVGDGGNTKALYIHGSQFSKFVDTCISNVNIVVYIEDKSRNPQDQHNDLVKQLISLLQQGMASAEQTIIGAKHWDQVWSPADLNPDKITREMNSNFIYNEDETKRHNFSDTYFDRRTGSSSSSTVSGWGVSAGTKLRKSKEKGRSNSQEQAQTSRQISSLTEINHNLNKRHLQLEWTGEKLIPKSFTVVRLSDLEDSLQVHLAKKNLMVEKARGANVHTLKGLHQSDIEDAKKSQNIFMDVINQMNTSLQEIATKSKAETDELKKRLNESKAEIDKLKKRRDESKAETDKLKKALDDAKTSQNSIMDVIQQINVSLQEIQAKINLPATTSTPSTSEDSATPTKITLPAVTSTPSTSEDSATPTNRGIELFQYSAEARRRAEVEKFLDVKYILCSASGLFNVEIGEQGGDWEWSGAWRKMVDGSGESGDWLWWWLMMPHPADNLVVWMSLLRHYHDNTLVIDTTYRKIYQRETAPPHFTIDCEVSLIIGNEDGTSTIRTLRKQHKITLVDDTAWSDLVKFPAPKWGVVNRKKPPTVKIQLKNIEM